MGVIIVFLPELSQFIGFRSLQSITNYGVDFNGLRIIDCNKLNNLQGLEKLVKIDGTVLLNYLENLESFKGLSSVGEYKLSIIRMAFSYLCKIASFTSLKISVDENIPIK